MAETKQKQLDLVFVCDCTGSMGSYLAAAQQNITKIATDIVHAESCDVRFALVQYRDHPPEDRSFAVRASTFTSSTDEMQQLVSGMRADGGGDTPESVADGLDAALAMPWRDSAAKVVCLIADAPPHGLPFSGDGFPAGCPCGKDPVLVSKSMAERGIVVYAIGAEPGLSSSCPLARDFMRSLAERTTGLFLPLSGAGLLAGVITAGAREQLQMREAAQRVAASVRSANAERAARGQAAMSEKETQEHVQRELAEANVQMTQISLGDVYGGAEMAPLDSAWFQYDCITTIRDKLRPAIEQQMRQQRAQQMPAPPPYPGGPRRCMPMGMCAAPMGAGAPMMSMSMAMPSAAPHSAPAKQELKVSTSAVSAMQAQRVYSQCANQHMF